MNRLVSLCGVIALVVFMVLTSPDTGAAATVDDMGIRAIPSRISSGPSVDAHHTCAVKADGSVRCWGANGNGQLGDVTFTNRTTPVPVPGIKDATAVAAGDVHTCAQLATATVICWGANADGQLGDGTVAQRSKASLSVSGLSNVVAIGSGAAHSCAVLGNGTVSCWGRNTSGQLGNGTTKGQLKAGAVSNLTNAIAVAGGGAHTCALLADGSVKCWGDNAAGQLGLGTTAPQLSPGAAVALAGPAVAIAAGGSHTCALLSDGTAQCWGLNDAGQLGDGTLEQRTVPTPVSGLAGGVAIESGARFTCARLATGIVSCWGRNAAGQLGDGTNIDRLTPIATVGLTDAVAVAGGNAHSCALQANDAARCWGDNGLGQLGNGTTSAATVPQVVGGGAGTISARGLAAGNFSSHTCARRADGTLACWGNNASGQLGFVGPNQLQPRTVSGLTNVVAATAGTNFSCALDADGAIWCWGANVDGQLGDGTTTNRPQPALVAGLPGPAIAVAAGGAFTCAQLHDGTVYCWGRNTRGQLGDGSLITRSTPAVVPGLEDVVSIAAGVVHTCAVLGNGGVRCWGGNTFGAVGDGTTTDRLVPTAVVGLPSAAAIAAGAAHTCALLTDGTARCWGRNDQGQVGIGVLGDMTVPVTPLGLTGAAIIALGGDHTCAGLLNGEVRCWGDNGVHQASYLTGDQLAPVTVVLSTLVPLRSVVALGTGNFHSCAIQASGAVYCWGSNGAGSLGDGTQIDRQFPTETPSFRFNIAQSAELQNGKGRVARVTALMNCPEGAQVHVEITLTQDGVKGHGHGSGKCTGLLEEYEVTVPAHGRNGFEPGAAVASADAVVKDRGRIVDTQEWTRSIELEVKP